MEPKFQSSFIPKSSATSSNLSTSFVPKGGHKQRSLFHTISVAIFSISAILAILAFGYKLYLNYSIDQMGVELENARAALQLETIREITRLNNRMIATEELVNNHIVLTPLFEFLESATPRTVRFTDFNYSQAVEGVKLTLRGEARGYSALALLADVFNKSGKFTSSIFSNLSLNDKGDVIFNLEAVVSPSVVSYISTMQ